MLSLRLFVLLDLGPGSRSSAHESSFLFMVVVERKTLKRKLSSNRDHARVTRVTNSGSLSSGTKLRIGLFRHQTASRPRQDHAGSYFSFFFSEAPQRAV